MRRILKQINLETDNWNTLVKKCATMIIIEEDMKKNLARRLSFKMDLATLKQLGLKNEGNGHYKLKTILDKDV